MIMQHQLLFKRVKKQAIPKEWQEKVYSFPYSDILRFKTETFCKKNGNSESRLGTTKELSLSESSYPAHIYSNWFKILVIHFLPSNGLLSFFQNEIANTALIGLAFSSPVRQKLRWFYDVLASTPEFWLAASVSHLLLDSNWEAGSCSGAFKRMSKGC